MQSGQPSDRHARRKRRTRIAVQERECVVEARTRKSGSSQHSAQLTDHDHHPVVLSALHNGEGGAATLCGCGGCGRGGRDCRRGSEPCRCSPIPRGGACVPRGGARVPCGRRPARGRRGLSTCRADLQVAGDLHEEVIRARRPSVLGHAQDEAAEVLGATTARGRAHARSIEDVVREIALLATHTHPTCHLAVHHGARGVAPARRCGARVLHFSRCSSARCARCRACCR
jgi:hypothetical protein